MLASSCLSRGFRENCMTARQPATTSAKFPTTSPANPQPMTLNTSSMHRPLQAVTGDACATQSHTDITPPRTPHRQAADPKPC